VIRNDHILESGDLLPGQRTEKSYSETKRKSDSILAGMERAYIHIAGPSRAGKTTLIEHLLEFSPFSLLVARCSNPAFRVRAFHSGP
jgi:type IV secretory pathway ATPase VirB11/archaellum biosynthesis ATPase